MNSSKAADNTLDKGLEHGYRATTRTISRRFAIGLITAMILVSAITIMGFYIGAIREQKVNLARKADEYMDYLSTALELPLWNLENNTIISICKTFSQNDLIVRLLIKNASGSVIYNFKKNGNTDTLERASKLYHQGELLGEIELSLTKQYIKETGRKLLSTYATIMLLVSVSLIFITNLFLRIFLKKPLDILDKNIQPYAKGIYDLPMPDLPYLEFQAVGRTLSRMRETIRFQIKEISDAEKKYHSIFANAKEGIFQCTPQGAYLNVNPALARIHGYHSPEEYIANANNFGFQHFVNVEDFEIFRKIIANQGYVEEFITEAYRKDKSKIWVSTNARAIRDDEGKIIYYEGSVEDITERKLATEALKMSRDQLEYLVKERTSQLEIAKELAEKANRAKTVFLANMSHELRTPLNAILGFSHLMKDSPDTNEEQRNNLDIITQSGGHLLNLINNVLDISKIESGRLELEETPFDLFQIMQEMKSLMSVSAQERGLNFILEQSPDVPRNIIVDGGKLRQVLINLIGNAIKYTKKGRVILRAMVSEKETQELVYLRFEVEDTGPGINKKDIGQIFLPFVQLGGHMSTQTGTGLGLAICKQYVELMNGQIGVNSELGKGSTFHFEIPVTVNLSAKIPATPEKGRVIGLAEGQPRHRLLIAEDQLENRILLKKILEPLQFDILEAVNGQEAIDQFNQRHPDMIFMDIRMPIMDGLEAARRIKATDAGTHTKIIAVTAQVFEEERTQIMEVGCDDFIRKPYRYTEIFETLSLHLGLKFIYEISQNHYPSNP